MIDPFRSMMQQLERLEARAREHSQFAGIGAEQLWTWQQRLVTELRDALRLSLPQVYTAPQFHSTTRVGTPSGTCERGYLETEAGVWVPLKVWLPGPQWSERAVIVLQDVQAVDDALVHRLLNCGALVVELTTRLAVGRTHLALPQLCSHLLRAGRTALGCAAVDCMRTIDFLETHSEYPVEEVSCLAGGLEVLVAAATSAVDTRIRRLVLGVDQHSTTDEPMLVGSALNDPAALLTCHVPRFLHLSGAGDNIAGLRDSLAQLYEHAGRPENFSVSAMLPTAVLADYLTHSPE